MSLNIARSLAVSSLMVTQVKINVASANISNADTAGYTQKSANQVALVSGGDGAGTTITGITSNVDRLLLKSLMQAASGQGAASVNDDYLNQLQALFGTTATDATGTSLANTLASLETAIASLAGNSGSAALQANTVSALDAVAAQLRETSRNIQTLRGNADKAISSSVDEINAQLKTIGSLNAQIKQAAATGQPTADLDDQRNTALQVIAAKMNVSYFVSSTGDMQIYTSSGQALLDSTVHALSYTAASTVTASTAYSATPPSGFSGIKLNGVDITTQVTSGEIGGLISLRDSELPAAQAQLDQLATQLASSLNAVSNQGTAVPAPSSLTGSASVTATTALSATGTVRFATVDSSRNLVSYQDLNLASYSTVGALVSAVNAIPGLSASINGAGHVVIASTTGDGVAINEMTSSVGSAGAGLSDWLGLNDLVSATGASDFLVRSDIVANSGLLQVATLDASATLTVGSQVLSTGSAIVTSKLTAALSGPTSFAAVGGLGANTGSFTDYAAGIVSDAAAKANQAKIDSTAKQTAMSTYSSAMASQSGVNLDEETANLNLLQNQYAAASQLIQAINQMFTALLTAVQSAG